MNFVLKARFFV